MTVRNADMTTASAVSVRLAIIVAALGYFVDVYDIALFSIIRVSSLRSIGLTDEQLLVDGVFLLNVQMAGMLLGGILWGVLGDKLGRVEVLFGSILMYSMANLANAFVSTVDTYALCRFFAGLGLAGEIGAGITLVAEMMPKERRGLATTIVATVGVFGSCAAALVGDLLDWRTAYIIGAVGGFALLALRIGVYESGMFNAVKHNAGIPKGDLRLLFRDGRLPRYAACVCAGMPMFLFLGLLMTFSPELGRALNITGEVRAPSAVLYYSLGITLGDVASGLLSQYLKSRKKVLALFITGGAIVASLIVFSDGQSPRYYYTLAGLGGVCMGYWAVLVTTSAEQFGTNLRATVTSTVPNFVRGATIGITLLFEALKPHLGTVSAAQIVAFACMIVGGLGVYFLRETFHVDLNFVELNGVEHLKLSKDTSEEEQLPLAAN
jgi:MFS transporter, putative metabolite:H+ symporter